MSRLREIHAVDAATFADLDRLERYPEWYDRIRLNTPWGEAWCHSDELVGDGNASSPR